MRVVIAEDDSIVEFGLRKMLKNMGHEVVGSARNGDEAVRLVQDLHPDIALLDVVMPESGGLEAARTITEKCPVAILILTAFSEHNLIKEAEETGVFAYLLKPVTIKQLEAAMSLSIAKFNNEQSLKEKANRLENDLENRKLIDRARQILAGYLGISEGEALRRMQAESRRQRRKLEETAKAIIATRDILTPIATPEPVSGTRGKRSNNAIP